MRRILPDLWETRAFVVPQGPRTHAYLWTPPSGRNILFYSPGNDEEFDQLHELGGVARQYLSHQDEAGPMLHALAERFGSRLHAPAAEAAQISSFAPIDVLLSERGVDDAGVEVVPTPGHSPGSTCYVVPGHDGLTYLFTGDTLLRYDDGVWRAGYVPGYSDKAGLRAALDTLATVQPDVVISSAFVEGAEGFHRMDRSLWQACLDQARTELN
ncbi:MBL fold metallo-hydrolase [Nocardia donostiensis]|uniref:MBL fold metallo-hydrolase n=1 Tax=Nocardia donostiensis TaxID=1538463 RepID=A0A1W0B909_9NOCA|nr:MBL fold metallo-hydrolase [Nocardia donostiensis]ONM48502.1 MBL fold metallo-hydrolase [Nocardia donostiensis]OQS16111.1 MBL fold metallo-hydrolase [Nocardia donostiensis]OQS18992.1 MBL fold metallo-hydrolase [Nocardia donostiensis]